MKAIGNRAVCRANHEKNFQRRTFLKDWEKRVESDSESFALLLVYSGVLSQILFPLVRLDFRPPLLLFLRKRLFRDSNERKMPGSRSIPSTSSTYHLFAIFFESVRKKNDDTIFVIADLLSAEPLHLVIL